MYCQHTNKAFSLSSVSNYSGTYTQWICKDCGYEGSEFVAYHLNDDYEATKQKFRQNPPLNNPI